MLTGRLFRSEQCRYVRGSGLYRPVQLEGLMAQQLSGYCVLVVEDEFFLAIEIEDALTRAGAEIIGPLASVEEALDRVRANGFDLAVLDINLGGHLAYPVADELTDRGVPFLFASAYVSSEIPPRHKARRLMEKPYNPSALVAALVELTGRST